MNDQSPYALPTRSGDSPHRVLWVADNLTTGGIGTVSQYAAEALNRIPGWTITLLSLRPPPSDYTDATTGVRHVSLGLGDDAAVAFLHWLERNWFDVIVTNHVPQIESAFSYLPAKSALVICIHDTGQSHKAVALRNARFANGVITVARHIETALKPELERINFRGLIGTVHNGAYYPSQPTRTLRSDEMRLLYMGSMDPFKGILDIAHIMNRTRQLGVPATLTIAGGHSEPLAKRLQKFGLDPVVTWTGWVDHDRCYDLAAASDVLVMPSRKEAFGMVTIEAMAMGCIPIAYDIASGSREIIEHERSGFLVPLGAFRTAANYLKRLRDSPSQRQSMSLAAIQRARTVFSAERMALDVAAFLSRVIDRASNQPAERAHGQPPTASPAARQPRAAYQRLPRPLREWIRNTIGGSPHLCHWLLNRW